MDGLFARYGTAATLNGEPLQVIFQPQGSQGLQPELSPLGPIPKERYVCYFPGEAAAQAGDILVVQQESYVLCHTEYFTAPKGRVAYRWALCRKKGGECL